MERELEALLSAPPEPERPYVYRGTPCHINKFGILNPAALGKVVRCVTDLRTAMLRANPIAGRFDLAHLQAIHRYLFQDIYDWAGETRIVDFHTNAVPILQTAEVASERIKLLEEAGTAVNFTAAADIVSQCDSVFDELEREQQLRDLNRQAFIERCAYFLYRLFAIHPFRDGNGRALRLFFEQLAAAAGWQLNFDWASQLHRHETAYQAHCGDLSGLRNLFDQSLSGPRN